LVKTQGLTLWFRKEKLKPWLNAGDQKILGQAQPVICCRPTLEPRKGQTLRGTLGCDQGPMKRGPGTPNLARKGKGIWKPGKVKWKTGEKSGRLKDGRRELEKNKLTDRLTVRRTKEGWIN